MTAPAPRSAAPPDELVARFRDAMRRLWVAGDLPDMKWGVAVSGGPDSLALLLLAAAAKPGQVEAATVDHQLRPEAASEAAMVALGDTNRACIALAEFSETYPALATGRLKEQYDRTRSKVTCR